MLASRIGFLLECRDVSRNSQPTRGLTVDSSVNCLLIKKIANGIDSCYSVIVADVTQLDEGRNTGRGNDNRRKTRRDGVPKLQ